MHAELLMIGAILGAALIGGRVAARIGYPAILGEILAGIILGPPILGLIGTNEAITVLGDFGILLMMLYIGLHLDLSDLKRVSVPGLLAASGGFLVPTALGFLLMTLAGRSAVEALFVGLAMGVTSLATKSRILVDLKILDTRIAHVLVAGALLSDIAVLVVFAAVIGPETVDGLSMQTALLAGIKALLFGAGAWVVGVRILPALKRLVGDRTPDRSAALLGVVVFGLIFAWAAELAGIHAILGAFVAGLFIDKQMIGRKVAKDVEQRLATISIGVLAPFFFVSAGFLVSLDVFRTDLLLLIAVVVLATIGKIIGTAVFYLPSGNGWREGVVVGAGMNGRGAVEIIVAEIALVRGLIDQDVFSILVFMALFTTATVPVLLTLGIRWLQRRGELVKAGGRDRVLITGAGATARFLAAALAETSPVTMIDTNRTNLTASKQLGLGTVLGNALDELTLEEAGIDLASSVIAATPNAEVNVLIAQLAVEFGVPEVSVMLTTRQAERFNGRLGVVAVIDVPDELNAWDLAVANGTAQDHVIEFSELASTREASGVDTTSASDLAFPIVVSNNGEQYPFTNCSQLTDGDRVIVLRRETIVPASPVHEVGTLG